MDYTSHNKLDSNLLQNTQLLGPVCLCECVYIGLDRKENEKIMHCIAKNMQPGDCKFILDYLPKKKII